MTTASDDALINWEQLADLVGDGADPEQRQMLVEMWGGMVADVRSDWRAMDGLESDADLRAALHRVRGVVSMWGMDALSGFLLECEKSEAPRARWAERSAVLTGVLERSIGAVERRHPGLVVTG
jgi:hypothetical protein